MPFTLFRKTPSICCVTLVALPAMAQSGPEHVSAEPLPEVVISATRTPENRRDVAASVDTVDATTLRQMGPQINLSEALQRVPGLGVLNRQINRRTRAAQPEDTHP